MNTLLRLPVKKKYIQCIFWIVLFFPFVKPSYIGEIEKLDTLIDVLRLCSLGIIFLIILRKPNISKVSLLLIAFVLTNIFSTQIQSGNIIGSINYALLGIGSFLLVDIIIRQDSDNVFSVFLPIFEFLIYINLFTIIKYPNGLYTLEQITGWKSEMTWFLGLRNGMSQWILIAAYLGVLYLYSNGMKIKTILRTGLLLTACLLSVILVNNATSSTSSQGTSAGGLVAGCILYVLYFFIPTKIKTSGLISFYNAIQLNAAIFLLFIIFRLQNLFSWFIEGVLNKDLTFTGRTNIWDNALLLLRESPIFGLGFDPPAVMANKLGNIAAVFTTHNTFIDILYHGGLIAIILLLLSLYLIHKNMKQYYNTKISSLISYTVCVFFIMAQFEGFSGVPMFILLAFAWNTPRITNLRVY